MSRHEEVKETAQKTGRDRWSNEDAVDEKNGERERGPRRVLGAGWRSWRPGRATPAPVQRWAAPL